MIGVVGAIVETREHLARLDAIASSLAVARVWRTAGLSSTVGDVEALEHDVARELDALAMRLGLPRRDEARR